ncbi:MAG TPA: hypothetical protein VK453_04705 [Micromonosporaceae bacterium]|nr:hypothetical protein [Micromonosporaceae bacterium]
MTNSRNPSGPVIGATVISAAFALLFVVTGAAATILEGSSEITVGVLVLGVLVGLTAWSIWIGNRAGQIAGVAVGVLLAVTGVRMLGTNFLAPVIVIGAVALIVLLLAPASTRSHFSAHRRAPVT